jgi:hypothetical protein
MPSLLERIWRARLARNSHRRLALTERDLATTRAELEQLRAARESELATRHPRK